MDLFLITLIVATFLCSLVAGFLFAFAVVVMPGIKDLDDGGFLRAFQVMDRVIQNNQPLFMIVWVGSVLSLIAAAALGFGKLEGLERWFLAAVGFVFLFGVQFPTVRINIPLNHQLQALDVGTMNEAEQRAAREAFEPRWNRWNRFRTILSCLVSASLIVLLARG